MSRYRKVDPRIWNDAKFTDLSERGRLVFLFVLTHPHMTMLGAMRATIPGLATELKMDLKGFSEAFAEASSKGMVKHCEKAHFIWLPNFLKYNRPESPNVVKSWPEAFDLVPECDLKDELFQRLTEFSESLTEAFREAFAKAMPNQEQEQQQKQDKNLPPRKERAEVDERFRTFVDAIDKYWKFKNPDVPFAFGKSEGQELKRLLADNPKLDIELFKKCLNHRAKSTVVHTERPRKWLGNILTYAAGPLDRFGKPLEDSTNGTGQSPSKGTQRINERRRALAAAVAARQASRTVAGSGSGDDPGAEHDAGSGPVLMEKLEPVPDPSN